MPAVVWVLFGSVIGSVCVGWSERLVVDITSNFPRRRATARWWRGVGGAFGGVSGWLVAGIESVAQAVVVIAVVILTAVQSPIDLQTHKLSRPPTVIATVVISIAVVAGTLAADTPRTLLETSIAALVLAGVYATVHRVSPRSLGWGDVLITFPLALAVGFVALDKLLVWQLLAATSGAMHAAAIRLIHKTPNVPFGPHLLIGAWAVLVSSV